MKGNASKKGTKKGTFRRRNVPLFVPDRVGHQAMCRACRTSLRNDYSAELTRTPPKPKKLSSFEASAVRAATCMSICR